MSQTEPRTLSVKIAKTAPSSATAVAEVVCSDRLAKVTGVSKSALNRSGFSAKVGETLVLHDDGRARVLVGVGPSGEVGGAELRTAAAKFARAVTRHRKIAFVHPEALDLDRDTGVRAIVEGLILGAYKFSVHKPASAKVPSTDSATVAVSDDLSVARAAARRGRDCAEAVCFARDLVNEPGGSLTPTVFAERAAERAHAAGLGVEIYDEARIAEERLGGLIAVNLGSTEPPRLLKLTYEPAADTHSPEAGDGTPDLDTVALVGKGITFDSGGLSIKPAESMMEMKMDMAGAAAVIAAMCALPALEVPVRVVSFTPMTDNMTGGSAQRPGDIYTSRSGKTVEVLNTDAEGRLVLADALTLASEEDPAAIVDLATLTGACVVALGNRIAGLMGNDDDFCGQVADAAEVAGERVWPLPLPPYYRKQLDSSVADIKNIGAGRYGGALTAGLFLSEFVDDEIPWVHLDIAGPAFASEPDGEHPKGGTGFGVRTLLSLLENWDPQR